MNHNFAPPPPPAAPPPSNRYGAIGNFMTFQPQPNQGNYGRGESSSGYDRKRPSIENQDGSSGGRSGGRGRGRGRGGRGQNNTNHSDNNHGRNYYGNNNNVNINNDNSNNSIYGNSGGNSNGNGQSYGGNKQNFRFQNQGRGGKKNMFKPDMIQDPWQQLAQKLVPKGMLDVQELEHSFMPNISSVFANSSVFNPPPPPPPSLSTAPNLPVGALEVDLSDNFGDNFLVYNHHKLLVRTDENEQDEEDEDEKDSEDIGVLKNSLLNRL